MKRKLVKHGPSTLMLSLPKKWIEKNDLSSGSQIEIKVRGRSIELIPEKFIDENKILVNIHDDEKRSIKHILWNCYKAGFDEVKLKFKDSHLLSIISQELYGMMGFEIVKESKDSCTLKLISEFDDSQFEIFYKKIFFSIRQMFDLTIEDLKAEKLDNLEVMENMKKRVRRFNDFCRRFLVMSSKYESHFYSHYLFLSNCSYLNSLIFYLYGHLKECSSKNYKAILPFIDSFQKAFIILYESVLKLNLSDIYTFDKLVIKAKKDIEILLTKSSSKFSLVLADLLQIERVLNQAGGPASGMIILKR